MKTKTAILSLTAITLLLPSIALADNTLFWGGSVEGTHVNSTGALLTAPAFTFQIGAFDAGFNPSVAPLSMWATNWNVFDTAVYDNDNMYFDSTAIMSTLGSSSGVNADAGFDFRGSKLYIWIYDNNTIDPLAAISRQWALVSGTSWDLPSITSDAHSLPLEFRLDNANQAWIGAVDPDGAGGNSPIVGQFGQGTGSGSFDVKTFAAVPEPSAALLSLLGIAGLLTRRNRKN